MKYLEDYDSRQWDHEVVKRVPIFDPMKNEPQYWNNTVGGIRLGPEPDYLLCVALPEEKEYGRAGEMHFTIGKKYMAEDYKTLTGNLTVTVKDDVNKEWDIFLSDEMLVYDDTIKDYKRRKAQHRFDL